MSDEKTVRTIEVRYRIEDEGVGAEVPEVPEWTIVGATIAEVRELVLDGIEFAIGTGGPFALYETFEDLRQASGSAVA